MNRCTAVAILPPEIGNVRPFGEQMLDQPRRDPSLTRDLKRPSPKRILCTEVRTHLQQPIDLREQRTQRLLRLMMGLQQREQLIRRSITRAPHEPTRSHDVKTSESPPFPKHAQPLHPTHTQLEQLRCT